MMTQAQFLAEWRKSVKRQCESHGLDPDSNAVRGLCNNLATWIGLEIEEGQRELAELRAKLDKAESSADSAPTPAPTPYRECGSCFGTGVAFSSSMYDAPCRECGGSGRQRPEAVGG